MRRSFKEAGGAFDLDGATYRAISLAAPAMATTRNIISNILSAKLPLLFSGDKSTNAINYVQMASTLSRSSQNL